MRCGSISWSVISKLFLVLILFSIISSASASGIQYLPENEKSQDYFISFEEGEEIQFADVRPGNNESVKFPGTINGTYFKDKNISKIICTLEAKIDHRWYAEENKRGKKWFVKVQPERIELGRDEQERFKVIVDVPSEISFNSKGELSLTGTVRTLPNDDIYQLRDVNGLVRIQYYADWDLSTPELKNSVKKGEQTVFKVNINNLGNARDIFYQSVHNEKTLLGSEIKIEFPSTMEVGEKAKRTFEIVVKTNKDTPSGEYPIRVSSYPTDINEIKAAGGQAYQIEFTLIVEPTFIEKYWIPSLIVIVIILIIIVVKIVRRKR
ncbi:MAG: hypothetical protein JSV49_05390 [Thermoplasmata archaeon]|nr:MAG: hypothetical protein JSV49_05390 [Thermoplasmata archaeon]